MLHELHLQAQLEEGCTDIHTSGVYRCLADAIHVDRYPKSDGDYRRYLAQVACDCGPKSVRLYTLCMVAEPGSLGPWRYHDVSRAARNEPGDYGPGVGRDSRVAG